jgi:hypothetical protein
MKVNTLESYSADDRFSWEDNDCVVCAVSNVCETSYAEVHAYLKKAGRKTGKGFHTYRHFGGGLVALNRNFRYEVFNGTLAQFARSHSVGKYLVTIHRHAICVIDGVIVESNSRARVRAQVLSVWKVETLTPDPIHPSVAAWDAFADRCHTPLAALTMGPAAA